MKEVFSYLKELQNIDLRISEIRNSKIEYPETLQRLEDELAQARQKVEDAGERLEAAQQEKNQIDTKVQEAKEALDSSQERMDNISTNKEYDAIQKEIAAHKKIIANSDSQRESLAQEIADAQQQKDAAAQELADLHESYDPQITELREKIAAIDARIEEAQKQRENIAGQIPRRTLSSYNFILGKRKDGRVLGYVGERGICSHCYKILEPQLLNEVRRGEKVIKCQSCGSLLVAQSQESQAEETQKESDQQ